MNLYDLSEDDSKDFEKQETGDVSTDSRSGNKTEDVSSFGVGDDATTKGSTQTDNTKKTNEPNQEDLKRDDNAPKQESPSGDGSEENEDDTKGDEQKVEPTKSPAEEPKNLTADEKNSLREEYTRIYKDILKKTNIGKSFVNMTLQEKMNFLKSLSEKWTKNDPTEFLTDREFEKLNKMVVKQEEMEAK